MLYMLASALCQQQRFAEAESLLLEHKRELSARDCPARARLFLHKTIAGVLARSGKASAALPLLISVATNSLGTVQDCADASFIAIASGDLENYRRMCALGMSRFAAGAEGINAWFMASMLLAAPQDEVMLQVAGDMV